MRKKSTVTPSDSRGSAGAAAQSAVRTELPRTSYADQVEPAARGIEESSGLPSHSPAL